MGKPHEYNFIDLFSGAGGLSCGMEMAGWKCLLGVDHDKYAIETFTENHRYADTFCGDMAKLDTKKLKRLVKDQTIHAVVGGPPCQGFSTVGLGNPKDMRNKLFLQFVRIVKETKPWFVVVENVTGMLAKKNENVIKEIFKKFHNLGYSMDVKMLSSDEYGVPEKRRRTIIIGTRISESVSFPVKTHNITKKNGQFIPPLTVGEALNDMKTACGLTHNHDVHNAQLKSKLDLKRLNLIPEGMGIRYEKDEKAYLPKILRLDVDWKKIPEGRFRQMKYQRLDRNKVSPTIMTNRHGYFHPTENRYFTQREAARIQSFPNTFVFKGTLSAQWRQIGNAVPPLLGRAIAKGLNKMIKEAIKAGTLKEQEIKNIKQPKNKSAQIINSVRSEAFLYKKS